MELIRKLKLDVWISVFLIISSLFFLNIASGFPETAGLFPKIILNSVLVLSIVVIAESIIKTIKGKSETKKFSAETFKNVSIMYALVVLYFVLFKQLGFIIATILFCTAGSWLLGSKSLIKNLTVGLVINIFIYLAFVKFLNVQIPLLPYFI